MIETIVHSLSDRLQRRIQSGGPITFADWMRAALYDPDEGYYCRADRLKWGREGDYRTSPERSELFAATFARYFARLYEEMGQPARWTILEAGSGGGHFAHGVLQTLKRYYPHIFAATSYVFDELSLSAQEHCREQSAFRERVEFGEVANHVIDSGVIFSNELLDALPAHCVTVNKGILMELFVDVDGAGKFKWVMSAPSTPKLQQYLDFCGVTLNEGQIAEISLEVETWLREVSASLRRGYVVTVDYGAAAHELFPSSLEDPRYLGTLRGFRKHAIVDEVLTDPGGHDLTTTVNWTLVEKLGRRYGLEVVDFKRQDKFLLDEGLLTQLEIETRDADSDSERLRLSTAAREMIMPDSMATAFQVLVQRKVG